MKKSLIALAVLGSLAAAAHAQSNVTLYGRIDLGLQRGLGDDITRLEQASGSRLGVRGVEDLGGGLKALFNLEHRLNADTGAVNSANSFWNGRSVVGLEGGFGQVVLGREYTPARNIANRADPWGGDTVGRLEPILFGGILPSRQNNSITYTSPSFSGVRAQAQYALDEADTGEDFYGLNLSYGAGPLSLAYGYNKAGVDDNTWHLVTAGYDFGSFRLVGAYGQGKPEGVGVADKHRSFMIGATAPLGAGELKVGYGKLKEIDPDQDVSSKFAIGYHYALSKRTTVYVDVANDRELADNKTGFDIGLKHNF